MCTASIVIQILLDDYGLIRGVIKEFDSSTNESCLFSGSRIRWKIHENVLSEMPLLLLCFAILNEINVPEFIICNVFLGLESWKIALFCIGSNEEVQSTPRWINNAQSTRGSHSKHFYQTYFQWLSTFLSSPVCFRATFLARFFPN